MMTGHDCVIAPIVRANRKHFRGPQNRPLASPSHELVEGLHQEVIAILRHTFSTSNYRTPGVSPRELQHLPGGTNFSTRIFTRISWVIKGTTISARWPPAVNSFSGKIFRVCRFWFWDSISVVGTWKSVQINKAIICCACGVALSNWLWRGSLFCISYWHFYVPRIRYSIRLVCRTNIEWGGKFCVLCYSPERSPGMTWSVFVPLLADRASTPPRFFSSPPQSP